MLKKGKLFLKNNWQFLIFIISALLIRFYFVDKAVNLSGDLLVHKEWGERYWQVGAKNFYFDENWYYSKPTQPPITSLMFAGAFYLFDHRYILAELHNVTRFPPASFIIYFGKWGYEMMLKMPGILGDILLGGLIYLIILKITEKRKLALIGLMVYLFNPVSIFLSGVWGQTESLIAFFGILSFYLLTTKLIWLSPVTLFLSLYTKPTWVVLVPLYIFCIYFLFKKKNLNLRKILSGILLAGIVFTLVTKPFSGNSLLPFTKYITVNNMLPTAKGTLKATTSAFNLHSVAFKLDVNLASDKYLFIPANYLGYLLVIYVYFLTFIYISKKGLNLKTLITAGFIIGSGSTLFLTGMLERYLFLGFPFILILAISDKKNIKYFAFFNGLLFLNLIWAFYRRRYGVIDHIFTDNDFLLVRLISIINVFIYIFFVRSNIGSNLLKLRLWKK